MRSQIRLVAALVSAGLSLAVVLSGCAGPRVMPSPRVDTAFPPLRVLAFYDGRAEKPQGTVLPLIAANREAISDLAPLWYHVMPDGSLRDLSQNHVKSFARTNHIGLMPLVINNQGTSSFLLNAGTCTSGPCANAVANLAAMLSRENYDGLNIDFELLKTQARPGLTAFMRQLHARMQAMHKVLTVDIIPAGSRRQAQQAYDFSALARNSDDVVIMTYDAHDDTSKAGPIAPMSWVRQRVDLALKLGVPRNKLILGLADYGYDWTSSSHGTTIPLKQAEALASAKGITILRSADGEPHFTYTKNGVTHTVWYEDGRAILPKIQLARQLKLKGIALWMAGYETAHYWHSLRSAAGTLTTSGASTASATSQAATSGATKASGSAPTGSASRSRPAASSVQHQATPSSGSASGSISRSGSPSASVPTAVSSSSAS